MCLKLAQATHTGIDFFLEMPMGELLDCAADIIEELQDQKKAASKHRR